MYALFIEELQFISTTEYYLLRKFGNVLQGIGLRSRYDVNNLWRLYIHYSLKHF